jgi:hypothetical protein
MTEASESIGEAFRKDADEGVLLRLMATATDPESTIQALA